MLISHSLSSSSRCSRYPRNARSAYKRLPVPGSQIPKLTRRQPSISAINSASADIDVDQPDLPDDATVEEEWGESYVKDWKGERTDSYSAEPEDFGFAALCSVILVLGVGMFWATRPTGRRTAAQYVTRQPNITIIVEKESKDQGTAQSSKDTEQSQADRAKTSEAASSSRIRDALEEDSADFLQTADDVRPMSDLHASLEQQMAPPESPPLPSTSHRNTSRDTDPPDPTVQDLPPPTWQDLSAYDTADPSFPTYDPLSTPTPPHDNLLFPTQPPDPSPTPPTTPPPTPLSNLPDPHTPALHTTPSSPPPPKSSSNPTTTISAISTHNPTPFPTTPNPALLPDALREALGLEPEQPSRAVDVSELQELTADSSIPNLTDRAQIAMRAAGAASEASQRASAYSAAASSAASKAAEAAERASVAATSAQKALEEMAEDAIIAAEARVARAVELAAEAEGRAASAAALATAYQDIAQTQATISEQAATMPSAESTTSGTTAPDAPGGPPATSASKVMRAADTRWKLASWELQAFAEKLRRSWSDLATSSGKQAESGLFAPMAQLWRWLVTQF